MSDSVRVEIKIESLDLNEAGDECDQEATATVAFGGSLSDMQIVSSKLCPVTGFPVVESKPSKHGGRVQWSGHRHLTVQSSTSSQQHDAWSDAVPEILEITVRFRKSVGVGFLVLRKSSKVQEIPLQSNDWKQARLRVRLTHREPDPPSVTACSSSSSTRNSKYSSLSHLQQLFLQPLQGPPIQQHQEQNTCALFMNWQELRQAVAACHAAANADDYSTIATRESWGEF